MITPRALDMLLLTIKNWDSNALTVPPEKMPFDDRIGNAPHMAEVNADALGKPTMKFLDNFGDLGH